MPSPRIQVLVCTNERPADAERACCAGRGGVELYRRFKDAVRERGLRDEILVTRTGCLHHCSHGAVVAAWPQSLWLGGVRSDDVDLVLDQLTGEPRIGQRVAAAGQATDPLARLRLAADLPWE